MIYVYYKTIPIWEKAIVRLLGRKQVVPVKSGAVISYDFLGIRYLDKMEII